MKETQTLEALTYYLETYVGVQTLQEFLDEDWFIEGGKVEFPIPHSEDDSSVPGEDVAGLQNFLTQNNIKTFNKRVMSDGGDKYTLMKVKYEDLVQNILQNKVASLKEGSYL